MKLEEIGFYTLSDIRAKTASECSPMMRGEIVLLNNCNFKCPYCRGIREDCRGIMSIDTVAKVIDIWANDGLRNIRFSGGEPTMHPLLVDIVGKARERGVQRIAISTNGSASKDYYEELLKAGVNDFSISLDACCSSTGKEMTGGVEGAWETTIENISWLSSRTYVTVGIVLTNNNQAETVQTILLAHKLGVADIRVISAAQHNEKIEEVLRIPDEITEQHPILRYRINNMKDGRPMRGLSDMDYRRCPLVMDDAAVAGNYHFPCIIWFREQGDPIGRISDTMRQERVDWFKRTNVYNQPICRRNCLDVCIDYNNRWMRNKQESNRTNSMLLSGEKEE